MLTVPSLEAPCHILLRNASNFTDFPRNSTELVECCQHLFTRYCEQFILWEKINELISSLKTIFFFI